MALDIQARESKDVTILDLKGKIILGEESASLRETIRSLLNDGKKKSCSISATSASSTAPA